MKSNLNSETSSPTDVPVEHYDLGMTVPFCIFSYDEASDSWNKVENSRYQQQQTNMGHMPQEVRELYNETLRKRVAVFVYSETSDHFYLFANRHYGTEASELCFKNENEIKREPSYESNLAENLDSPYHFGNSRCQTEVIIDDSVKSEVYSEADIKAEPVDYSFGEILDSQSVFANDHCPSEVNINSPENCELYSDVLIKEEPGENNMDTDMCTSEMDHTILDTDNHNLQPSPINQTVTSNKLWINDDESCSKFTDQGEEDTNRPGERIPTCSRCPGQVFVSETHLLAHTIEKHGFKVARNMENKISALRGTNSTTPKLQCTFCDFTCRFMSVLKKHVRTHTGEKPFQCTMCDFKCNEKGGLKQHFRIHTGEKPFQCAFCEYKCALKSTLQDHIRIHTGEKPFQCTAYGSKFRYKVSIRKHVKAGTCLKNVQCTICDFKGKYKKDLNEHMLTHNDPKPFHCKICDFKCHQDTELIQHVTAHSVLGNLWEFKCAI